MSENGLEENNKNPWMCAAILLGIAIVIGLMVVFVPLEPINQFLYTYLP